MLALHQSKRRTYDAKDAGNCSWPGVKRTYYLYVFGRVEKTEVFLSTFFAQRAQFTRTRFTAGVCVVATAMVPDQMAYTREVKVGKKEHPILQANVYATAAARCTQKKKGSRIRVLTKSGSLIC